MVDFQNMPLDELSALVTRYPWFGAARKALCCRTGQFAAAALYVFDRGILAREAANAGAGAQGVKEYVRKTPMEQKVVVLGGDYFSQDAYDSVRTTQVPRSAQEDRNKGEDKHKEDLSDDIFITETLAEIYATQGHLEQAKNIYSKLILRYPEKSAYFATLIEKLNNINNQ